jgi:toxin secretion/phage lysis holin
MLTLQHPTKMHQLTGITKFWMIASSFFLSYFAPIAEFVHIMLIFLLVDTISGIWAACKMGERLESNKLRKTVFKFLWYTTAVMLAWMLEKSFHIQWANLARFIAAFICFVELVSVFENIAKITDEPVFKRIARMFKKRSEQMERSIDDKDDDK